jgi:hypothetical protein
VSRVTRRASDKRWALVVLAVLACRKETAESKFDANGKPLLQLCRDFLACSAQLPSEAQAQQCVAVAEQVQQLAPNLPPESSELCAPERSARELGRTETVSDCVRTTCEGTERGLKRWRCEQFPESGGCGCAAIPIDREVDGWLTETEAVTRLFVAPVPCPPAECCVFQAEPGTDAAARASGEPAWPTCACLPAATGTDCEALVAELSGAVHVPQCPPPLALTCAPEAAPCGPLALQQAGASGCCEGLLCVRDEWGQSNCRTASGAESLQAECETVGAGRAAPSVRFREGALRQALGCWHSTPCGCLTWSWARTT